MKKIYIKPINKVYTVKVCTPVAVSGQETGDDTPEAETDEEFGARDNNFTTSKPTNIWSEEW